MNANHRHGHIEKTLFTRTYTDTAEVRDDVRHWAEQAIQREFGWFRVYMTVMKFAVTLWDHPDVDTIQLVGHPPTNSVTIRVCTASESYKVRVDAFGVASPIHTALIHEH